MFAIFFYYYFEILCAPSDLLLPGIAKPALLANLLALGSSNSEGACRISKYVLINSRPLFIITFKSKCQFQNLTLSYMTFEGKKNAQGQFL